MAKYTVIKNNKIENVIELEEDNYTTTYIINDRGDKLPTYVNEQGQTIISTTKWLVPSDCTITPYTGGNIGDDV